MQLRKLIRLLEKAKQRHGDRIECCIDAKFAETLARGDLRFISIPDVEPRSCVWNAEGVENPKERVVLVLGNY